MEVHSPGKPLHGRHPGRTALFRRLRREVALSGCRDRQALLGVSGQGEDPAIARGCRRQGVLRHEHGRVLYLEARPYPAAAHLPNIIARAQGGDNYPPFTTHILEILRDRHLSATFFIIGRHASEHPGLIRRIADEGHTLGNHSWDHHHFGINHGRDYWRTQLSRTNDAILNITGITPQLFRPPMGFKTWHLAAAARENHLRIVGWSARAFDTNPLTPDRLVARLAPRLRPGAIIALHDGLEPARQHKSQQTTVDALPPLLDLLAARRLRCVNLHSLETAAAPQAVA